MTKEELKAAYEERMRRRQARASRSTVNDTGASHRVDNSFSSTLRPEVAVFSTAASPGADVSMSSASAPGLSCSSASASTATTSTQASKD